MFDVATMLQFRKKLQKSNSFDGSFRMILTRKKSHENDRSGPGPIFLYVQKSSPGCIDFPTVFQLSKLFVRNRFFFLILYRIGQNLKIIKFVWKSDELSVAQGRFSYATSVIRL